MNANMGFELFSGVSAVFTMDLPTNWLVLLLESMGGPVQVEYVQQAQFPRVIDVFHRMRPQLSDDEMEADST